MGGIARKFASKAKAKLAARKANKGWCRACFKLVPKGSNMCRSRDCQLYGLKHPDIFDDEGDE